jgi:hypothetical protein
MKSSMLVALVSLACFAMTGFAGEAGIVNGRIADDGSSRICVRGEEGIRYSIETYQRILAALEDEDGIIPPENQEKARYFQQRLDEAYEMLDLYDPAAARTLQQGGCGIRETENFGFGDYIYTACADAEHYGATHPCQTGSRSRRWLDAPGDESAEKSSLVRSSAWAYLDISDLTPASGYIGYGLVRAYLNGQEKSALGIATSANPVLNVEVHELDSHIECSYASSQIMIFTSRISMVMVDYQYCEDVYPPGCY